MAPKKERHFRLAKVFGRLVPIYKRKGLLAEDTYGYYREDVKEIAVAEELKGEILEHTIIHELFHAVLDRLHIHQQLNDEFAEVLIENLAAAVVDNYRLKWKV